LEHQLALFNIGASAPSKVYAYDDQLLNFCKKIRAYLEKLRRYAKADPERYEILTASISAFVMTCIITQIHKAHQYKASD
jgi:hypothetical protein